MATDTQAVELSQLTAPIITVEAANGVTYAYRRFGRSDAPWPPLLFLQHFRGNLDNWDPLLVDTIAGHREVILLDNAGVGLSSGKVPSTVTEMARDAIAFLDALEIGRIDVLGYSLGGMVAQELALLRPRVVRRIVLAGTGPRGGQQMHGWTFDIERTANNANNGIEDLLHIFFEVTETSRALGREYIQRAFGRMEGADKPNGPEVARAQYDAIVEWGIPDPTQLNRLAGITQPTLVANGDNDMMIPTVNSQILADHLPNARLRIFADAAHGFLFQYPRQFAELVTEFLSAA
ncbi:alpha/beta fold hydrolase [Micromonospora sp. CB01531]|uniref:alpha/beta fold hydrolase n=1 Tax=Micromonospora sp. CB01531 TaxID=1718947 RepID=UPI00093FD856|nr:alpha/beta hydrolase [Micromonospora sp. CB01531]OKI49263.1 alpha/beta hydrolase [Micromonospora sp. CB01531]